MSRLFLIRHGQASFLEQNYDKLSAVGEQQARLLGEYWARQRLAFSHVYSGPRTRQIETARIAGEAYKAVGLPWPETKVMPEFDEMDADWLMSPAMAGSAENLAEVQKAQQAFLSANSLGEKHKTFQRMFELSVGMWAREEIQVDGIEPWAEFCARVQRGLSAVCARNGGNANIAVFSSGGPIGVSVQRALELSHENTLKVAVMARNSAFNEFLFSGERFTLTSFNSLPHLDDPALVTYR